VACCEENDQRLHQIETRKGADVVTSDKVDRISDALDRQKRVLDDLALKHARPGLGHGEAGSIASIERKQAFDAYMRSGEESALRTLETKDMSYGSGPDGGYLVPDETEAEIGRRLAAISPIRSIASVRQVSGAVLKKPFQVTGPAGGFGRDDSVADRDSSALNFARAGTESSACTLSTLNRALLSRRSACSRPRLTRLATSAKNGSPR
jgi:HK97 family phage major capsid protein